MNAAKYLKFALINFYVCENMFLHPLWMLPPSFGVCSVSVLRALFWTMPYFGPF